MKLNEKQLQQVKDYLKNKDVEYIDLHFEVVDHIASDIETKMKISKLDFETTFEKVKEKWKKQLSLKSSFWIGSQNYKSRILIDKCIKIYRPLVLKSVITATIVLAFIYGMMKFLDINIINFWAIYKLIVLITFLYFTSSLLFWRYKIKKMKFKTSYSFLFQKQVFVNIYFSLFIIGQLFSSDAESFDFFEVIVLASIVLINILGKIIYDKHIETIKKYHLL
ncbi:hypothetical protein R3X25_05400 [Lutibacter sp. TH_r2]|uniref:hypothetical protein n=1 Tax=Lutibacter sp. TH_r2 TaxID=3082083 RepID=UPI002955810A|nr:hypothetical protein [Lutibacter sp. TH_r2]MDV7186710.1 hypothetical protein [Lutibacter sp. TH_r2]